MGEQGNRDDFMKVSGFLLIFVKSLGIVCGMMVFAGNLKNSMIWMEFSGNLGFPLSFRDTPRSA